MEKKKTMKIVTVNIPESYLDSIKKLVGEHGLYPSRSELIRVAVREFLIKELNMANNMAKYKEAKVEEEEIDDESLVRVPVERLNKKDEPIREFKTYKIVKRLEDINLASEKPKVSKFDGSEHKVKDFGGDSEELQLKPSRIELREEFPYLPEYKHMNEG